MQNPETGIVTITFSSDSTCSAISSLSDTNVASLPTERNEILTLFPSEEIPWPSHTEYCHFPNWMHGQWEYVTANAKELTYQDHSSFKTYTMKCWQRHESTNVPSAFVSLSQLQETKFLAFSRTQCNEEQYHCVWVVKRSPNILEFQMGAKTVQYSNIAGLDHADLEQLCDDEFFDRSRWLTQGRFDQGTTVSPCPVHGEYRGFMPDAEGLCARLWSECQTPDIMYYQVAVCETNEILEGMSNKNDSNKSYA